MLREIQYVKFRSLIPRLALFLAVAASSFGQEVTNPYVPSPSIKQGIVIELLSKNAEADKAGIQPGDILLNWTRGDSKGGIESPFDLNHIRFEQASRGLVRIEGFRGTDRRFWVLGSDFWGIAARPSLQGELLSIYLEGEELARAGKITQAAERWRVAAAMAQQSGTVWLAPWLLSHAAQSLYGAQQWDAVDAAYREAIQQATGASPSIRAELFRQWASGFSYRDDLASAEKYYEEALQEWRKLGDKSMVVSQTLLQLGLVELAAGKLTNAEEYFRRSMVIAAELAPHSTQMLSDITNLGVVAAERGDLAKAESYLRRALALQEQFSPHSQTRAVTLMDLGVFAHQRGDLRSAETFYRKALTAAENLDPESLQVASILSDLGDCVLDRGDSLKAEEYQKRALSIRERVTPNRLPVAVSLTNLGKIAYLRGDLDRAEEYYRKALAISEKLDSPTFNVARLLTQEAKLLSARGDFVEAEDYQRSSVAIMEKVAPGSIDHVESLAELAGIMRHQHKLDAAAELYQRALSAFESETARLGGIEADRYRYRADHSRYYKQYVNLLMEAQQPALAFQVLEGSRGRTLLEILSRGHVDIRAGVDSSLLDREHELHQLLKARSEHRIRVLTGNHTNAQLAEVDSDVGELLNQYQRLETEIRAKSPTYAALTQPQPLSATELQQLLDEQTILLEYSLGEERSFVWVVTKNSLAAYELPKRAEIERVAHRVYLLLTARNIRSKAHTEHEIRASWAKADAEYSKAAMTLSRMVLGPIASLLREQRLLIVSDGALQYIPFSALPIPDSTSHTDMPLIVRHEIVNLPSASLLAELRRQKKDRKDPPKAVAVLADPVFDSADERVAPGPDGSQQGRPKNASLELRSTPEATFSLDELTRSADDIGITRSGEVHLSRLLSTRQEAEAIMAVTPAGKRMKAVDFEASRAMAMNPALAHYRIVHFATHGFLDGKNPELSGLILSLVDRRGKPQDGFLGLQDIYNLNLPVEMVVLSACETGLGEDISGEGLVGLTRGFMYAGASRVVASLWGVSDEATAELMTRFYKAMEVDRMRPAAALRTAQIQMWRQKHWSSPYYWAAFQIQGEWK